jgi:hypothetical protein
MKTTVVLPDDLLLRAKRKALEERCTLRTLIEDGLRLQVDGPVATDTVRERGAQYLDRLCRQPKLRQPLTPRQLKRLIEDEHDALP